ncbi:MAG TPA: AMP-binding protein, partial [Blastocatellia bacterium]|nr:AMP-binding protein [Blastocatellia bacterium]
MSDANIAGLLFESPARERDIAFVHTPGLVAERWTYGRVRECAFRFARALEVRGIGRGDRVVLAGPNCPEWVAAFYGSQLRGVVVVRVDQYGAT